MSILHSCLALVRIVNPQQNQHSYGCKYIHAHTQLVTAFLGIHRPGKVLFQLKEKDLILLFKLTVYIENVIFDSKLSCYHSEMRFE